MKELKALMLVIIVMIMFSFLYAMTDAAAGDSIPRDSQGVPCTISTAQMADGTRECK